MSGICINSIIKQTYREISNISRTKSRNLNISRLVLQLSFPYPLKPGVVGAAPTGDAPTTSEWSTILLPIQVPLILEIWPYLHKILSRKRHQMETFYASLALCAANSPVILCMHQTNERRGHNITSSLISWAHTQIDPWICCETGRERLTGWPLFKKSCASDILCTLFCQACIHMVISPHFTQQIRWTSVSIYMAVSYLDEYSSADKQSFDRYTQI